MDASASYVDYVVIGAGPGGLQLGWYLDRRGRDYVILEMAEAPGEFFRTLPRSRTLISFNRVHGLQDDPEMRLRWDWNSLLCDYEMPFGDFSQQLYPDADELIAYLAAFAERYALNIRYGTSVASVARLDGPDGEFQLVTGTGERIRCRSLVVATGLSRPHIPDIPGIELVTDAYETVTMDPAAFAGLRVLVIGKGNSALEFVEEIIDAPAVIHVASPTPIQFAWNTRHPGNVRANYIRLLDTYQLKLLNGTLDCTITGIRREQGRFLVDVAYSHADGETETLVYDRVVRAAGFGFDAGFLEAECRPPPAHGGRLPSMSPIWEAEGVPDLWFAGTLMQSRDFRRASSSFIDGFRYNIRTLGSVLDARYHDEPLPMLDHPSEPVALAEALVERIARTSGLWAQFGYLCDVVAVDNFAGRAYHLQELPVEFVTAHAEMLGHHWYRITFEWGAWDGDRFSMQRHPTHTQADASTFLHPVVRCFHGRELVEEHHMLEDLFGVYAAAQDPGTYTRRNGMDPATYHRTQHEVPLLDFLTRHHELRAPHARPRPWALLPHVALATIVRSAPKAAATWA